MADCRLVYTSIADEALLAPEALQALGQSSSEKNAEKGITGMLLMSGDRFLQVLEGPSSKVNALYRKIINDERHSEVCLVGFEQTGAKLFPDWGMRAVDLSDLPKGARDELAGKFAHEDGFLTVPEDFDDALELLVEVRGFESS